jgi:hypothetical protein
MTPVAYQSVPKEWVAYGGIEVFTTPPFDPNDGLHIAKGIFRSDVEENRIPSPENPGGYLMSARKSDHEFMDVQRSLPIWQGQRHTQEQFNRRLADISGKGKQVNAKLAYFPDQYSKEEMLAVTLELASVESNCFRLYGLVLYQGGRKMTYAGKKSKDSLPSTAIWEYPREKLPKIPKWAPRTTVYPTGIADIMEVVKFSHYDTLPADIEMACGEIGGLEEGRKQNVQFVMLSYEGAPKLSQWWSHGWFWPRTQY